MNAIILCGGIGSRLGEITKTIPKILLDIGDRTVLDFQMRKLQKLGIKEVVFSAGHLSDVLYKKVGERWKDVKIIYAVEPERFGTGGGIKFAMDYLKNTNEPTWILNGDVLTTTNLSKMYSSLKPDSDGIILGTKVEDASSYGTLVFDNKNKIQEFKEKEGKQIEGVINAGVYLFNPQVKKYFPNIDKFSIEYDVFPNMKDLYVYESSDPWIDIGIPERLNWANANCDMFKE